MGRPTFRLCFLLGISVLVRAEKPVITSAGKGLVAGGLFRISGKSLAAAPAPAEGTPWPLALGGTSVQVLCGERKALAALRSVAEDSIEGQLPYAAAGACLLKVVSGGEESSPVQVEIAAVDARIATDEGGLAVFLPALQGHFAAAGSVGASSKDSVSGFDRNGRRVTRDRTG